MCHTACSVGVCCLFFRNIFTKKMYKKLIIDKKKYTKISFFNSLYTNKWYSFIQFEQTNFLNIKFNVFASSRRTINIIFVDLQKLLDLIH